MDMKVFDQKQLKALTSAIEQGLPLVARPYAALALQIGCSEQEVINDLQLLRERGDIKRYGVVVRHRKLGYKANGMVVWDIPDEQIKRLGQCMGRFPFVTLCYQRPRKLPDWPYNLFTMVHGLNHQEVEEKTELLVTQCGLENIDHEILFSSRCFKQRGARYNSSLKDASGLTNESLNSPSVKS